MRLVVDTNVLVGELLRAAGRGRMSAAQLELFLPQHMREETARELPRRITAFASHRGMTRDETAKLLSFCVKILKDNVAVIAHVAYSSLEPEARRRSVRDPNDWPLVACALGADAAIWTGDNDLFGTGVATWTTETLGTWLDHQSEDSDPPVRHLALQHPSNTADHHD